MREKARLESMVPWRWVVPPLIYDRWTYAWDAQDRLVSVERDDNTGTGEDVRVEYKYCQTCGGAMSERIEYAGDMLTIVSWLRYEYDGLNLLRIDERYDSDEDDDIDSNDDFRPLNVFIHGPGAIGQIVKCKWYNYASDGQNPTSCCDSGEYYYFYDALGNVNGVLDDGGHYYRWEMDAFGNDLPSGNSFLAMDQPGPKEHLTGKMFDTTTGLYYFAARWYDPEVGRFVSVDKKPMSNPRASKCEIDSQSSQSIPENRYSFVHNSPLGNVDVFGRSWLSRSICYCCALNQAAWLAAAGGPVLGLDRHDNHNGGNALTHCVGSCITTKACGGGCAEWWWDRRETDGTWGNEMDLRNNAVGRACGGNIFLDLLTAPWACRSCCLEALNRGELTCREPGTGLLVPCPPRPSR